MYEFDHMLNGRGSRQHLQTAIREAQREKLAREVEVTQDKPKPVSLLRPILVILLQLIAK